MSFDDNKFDQSAKAAGKAIRNVKAKANALVDGLGKVVTYQCGRCFGSYDVNVLRGSNIQKTISCRYCETGVMKLKIL